jgi:hypothetical protein
VDRAPAGDRGPVYEAGVMPHDPESFGEFLKYRTGDIVSRHSESSEPLALQVEDFCRAIRLGTMPKSSARLGVDVVPMIEAADRSRVSDLYTSMPIRGRR